MQLTHLLKYASIFFHINNTDAIHAHTKKLNWFLVTVGISLIAFIHFQNALIKHKRIVLFYNVGMQIKSVISRDVKERHFYLLAGEAVCSQLFFGQNKVYHDFVIDNFLGTQFFYAQSPNFCDVFNMFAGFAVDHFTSNFFCHHSRTRLCVARVAIPRLDPPGNRL